MFGERTTNHLNFPKIFIHNFVMTNRFISGKIASWDFVPPFDFAAQFLASRATGRGEQVLLSTSENLQFPVWWNYMTKPEPTLNGTDRLRGVYPAPSLLWCGAPAGRSAYVARPSQPKRLLRRSRQTSADRSGATEDPPSLKL